MGLGLAAWGWGYTHSSRYRVSQVYMYQLGSGVQEFRNSRNSEFRNCYIYEWGASLYYLKKTLGSEVGGIGQLSIICLYTTVRLYLTQVLIFQIIRDRNL